MKKNSVERTVCAQGTDITYTLTIKKVKNINLRINRDKKISVSANRYIKKSDIDEFVIKNADFIKKAFDSYIENKNLGSKDREFNNGDIIMIFGKAHYLKVIYDDKAFCEIVDSQVILHTGCFSSRDKRAAIFYSFVDNLLIDIVKTISDRYFPKLKTTDMKIPKFKIRDMRSRYGSCKKTTGDITINRQIIAAPLSAISYLVCHELTHLVIPNHSADFYKVLSSIYPEYKKDRVLLRKFGTDLI